MVDRKLIFFSSSLGPDNDDAAWRVFRYAGQAADAGLAVEIVLAGPPTGLIRRDARDRLTGSIKEQVEHVFDLAVPIWLSPGCAQHRGVSDVDLKETGAQTRQIVDMFTDVAAGAQLVPCDR